MTDIIEKTIEDLTNSNWKIHYTCSGTEIIAKKVYKKKMAVIQVFRHSDGMAYDVFGIIVPNEEYDLTNKLANNSSRMKFFREVFTTSTYLGAFPIYDENEISLKISDIMKDADAILGVK